MKKIIAVILACLLIVSLTACMGKKAETETEKDEIVENVTDAEITDETDSEELKEAEDHKEEASQEQKPASKPEEKPQTSEKPQIEEKPAPEISPDNSPENKPAEKSTLGQILLSDFKSKANSGMSAEAIANGLLSNPAIKFGGGVTQVEEGLLSGFDNAEITGFKSGYMFAPMIGSIPFVGYIFELENTSDISGFVSLLKENTNPRWNICVTADETVIDSAGNKVFFVMCPETLEE